MKNNKSLGQHWLKDRQILDEIADLAAVGVDGQAVCLEIGPGLGTLTSSLLRRFSKVIAVEFDTRLAENLPKSFPGKNLVVLNQDILQTDVAGLAAGSPYVVAGNIPYYITSPIIRHLLEANPRAERIVLLVQKEVAERVAAGEGEQSLLSLSVQNLAEVELGPVVPASEFTPPPKVDSQVLVLTPLEQPIVSAPALALARRGFSSPRKKLVHNLAASGQLSKSAWIELLEKATINPSARAQDLSLYDWEELVKLSE